MTVEPMRATKPKTKNQPTKQKNPHQNPTQEAPKLQI